MASTFTTLGIEKMATGENAGTWGDKTNTNLEIVEKAVAGYVEKSIAGGAQTTALTITDGDSTESTSIARHAVIKLTGSITGNQVVTVPDSIEKIFIVTNGTSGAFTVQFKTVSGTGVTFGVSEKTTKLFYSDGTNIVDAGFSGGTDLDGKELILDADGDTSITADTDDQIDIKIANTDHLIIKGSSGNVVIQPATDTKDIIFNQFDGTNVATIEDNGTFNVPTAKLAINGTAITSTAAELNILDGVTSTAAELNALDGITAVVGELNALDIGATAVGTAVASKAVILDSDKDYTGIRNLTLTGDLTVGGDDITMGTNTDGNLLVADGTNFNSIAISSLSEISTAASDDVFIAIDTSGGGLKKIARSTVVAGLATDSAIANIVEDTSPQLGGNLDTNSQNILIDDAHFIADESGNEQIIFQTTGSAVNQFDVTNAATGSGPQLSATGSDSNIDLNILAKGTGHVTVVGNTNAGAIQFNCESNTHGQIIIAQPHSAAVTNTLTLPAGASSTLVSLVSTDTLTNKTLTSPKINEDVAVTATATEINLIDGDTSRGTTAVADGDGLLVNDNGTMRMTTVQTVSAYMAAESVGGGNIVTTGALNSGSITSGFGTIDTGSSAITTTGLISGGSLDIDNVLINGTTIGHTDDTDLLTVADGLLTVAGEISVTTLDIGGTNVTSTAAELNQLDGVVAKTAGKETIWVPANAMTPTTSNGCSALTTVETTSGRPDMNVLDFDKDSDEFAQFAVAFPKSYNLGTVTFQFYWSGLAATTGVSMSLQGVAMNDNETIDVAYGTAVVVDDDAQGAVEELLVSAESGAVTIAGTMADNDLVYFRIGRDVSDSNDDMAGDCRLHGIKLFFTTDAANDA